MIVKTLSQVIQTLNTLSPHTHLHNYTHILIYTHTRSTYIYTHTLTHTHTHTNTHTHTHTLLQLPFLALSRRWSLVRGTLLPRPFPPLVRPSPPPSRRPSSRGILTSLEMVTSKESMKCLTHLQKSFNNLTREFEYPPSLFHCYYTLDNTLC